MRLLLSDQWSPGLSSRLSKRFLSAVFVPSKNHFEVRINLLNARNMWFSSTTTRPPNPSVHPVWTGLGFRSVSRGHILSTGAPQGSVLTCLGLIISTHGFSNHFYADDTELYLSFLPDDLTDSAQVSVHLCLLDPVASDSTTNNLTLGWSDGFLAAQKFGSTSVTAAVRTSLQTILLYSHLENLRNKLKPK